MRAAILWLVAACELAPTPKQAPPPPVPAAPVASQPADAAAPVPKPTPKLEITRECEDTGVHIAEAYIESAADATQRRRYELDKTTIVRSAGLACTTQHWSEPARRCYGAAKTQLAVQACAKQFTPPPG